mgnify:CR=1 FL=1
MVIQVIIIIKFGIRRVGTEGVPSLKTAEKALNYGRQIYNTIVVSIFYSYKTYILIKEREVD